MTYRAGARYYCPDMVGFMPYMINKNGDSHRMDVLGLSIGRACTAGYVTAKLLAE